MFCEKCGHPLEGSGTFCTNCGHAVIYKDQPAQPKQPVQLNQPVYQQPVQPVYQPYVPVAPAPEPEKRENVAAGIAGAILGAVLGGASIVLLSQLGVVAALSGFLLAVCTLKGYEWLGKKLSTAGIIISVVLMLVTPYIADRIDWAILVMQAWEVGFAEAFLAIPELIDAGYILVEDYLLALGQVYLFVIIGAVSMVIATVKRMKK